MTVKTLLILIFTPVLLLGGLSAHATSGAGVTYHGRLVDPAGNPVLSSSVQFRLQIKTPGSENCLMYEEIQTKDMSTSNGVFALTLNDGSGARQDTSGYPLDQIFANRSGYTFPASYCASGTNYVPNQSDGRSLQVYFNDGTFSGWEPAPSQAINFIPMAIESMQVGGYKKENLVKVAAGVDTTGFDLTGANFAELIALITGTSTQFVKPGAATFTAAPQWAGTPSAGNDLANKTYVDAQIAAGLPNFGTAGTYTKVTTDAKGRVSSGTTLSATDIPALDAAKITTGVLPIANGGTNSGTALTGSKVMVSSGTAIVEGMASNTAKSNNTFVMRDGSGNIAGALGTFDGLSVLAGGNLMLNGATSGSVSLVAPTAPTTYTFTLPSTGGTNGYVLSTNGSGTTSWIPLSGAASISSLTAATTSNSIDNLNFGQTWNWSTATTQNALSMTADSITTGTLLNLTTSSASLNSTNGLLNVANSSGATTGTLARFQSNSTAGSGLTVLANGNIGVGTSAPSSLLSLSGSSSPSIKITDTTNSANPSITSGLNVSGVPALNFGFPGGEGTSRHFTFRAGARDIMNMRGVNNGEVYIGDGFIYTGSMLSVQNNVSIGTSSAAPTNGLLVGGNVGIGTATPTGPLDVRGGNSTVGAGTGITLIAQSALQSGGATTGGNITVTAGDGYAGGNGGNIVLTSGRGQTSGAYGFGSSITLTGTSSGPSGAAGAITLYGGGGQNGYGNGGTITVAKASSATGANVSMVGGSPSMGTNNGGNVLLDGGSQNGGGVDGNVLLASVRGNVGIGTTSPTAKLQINGGAIVATSQSSSVQCINFSTGNIQVSSYSGTNTIKIGGLVDGGAYTVVLTGYTAGQTVTISGFTDNACTTGVATGVDFGGSSSAVTPTFTAVGNTQLVTFIYSAAQGVVYASVGTNFYH